MSVAARCPCTATETLYTTQTLKIITRDQCTEPTPLALDNFPACYMSRDMGILNNVVCATSKGSDQPAHTRSLIRAFASSLNIL